MSEEEIWLALVGVNGFLMLCGGVDYLRGLGGASAFIAALLFAANRGWV